MKLLRVAIPSDLLDVDDHFHFHQFPKTEQQAYSSVQSEYLTGLHLLQTGFGRSTRATLPSQLRRGAQRASVHEQGSVHLTPASTSSISTAGSSIRPQSHANIIWMTTHQLLENYRNQSSEGLSTLFILVWLAGDALDWLGALLQVLLWTQIALAGYYVCCDIALLWQAYTQCHINGVRIQRHPMPIAHGHARFVPSTTNGTHAASENTSLPRGATQPGASTITKASAIGISRRPTRNRPLAHSSLKWRPGPEGQLKPATPSGLAIDAGPTLVEQLSFSFAARPFKNQAFTRVMSRRNKTLKQIVTTEREAALGLITSGKRKGKRLTAVEAAAVMAAGGVASEARFELTIKAPGGRKMRLVGAAARAAQARHLREQKAKEAADAEASGTGC
ncbi:hypothetical protein CF328_g3288 [Tilletia controversa]|nr:hypothetical protein CF328_g3288 [Tilletia controversa]